jgi:hypothetical protein
VPAAPATSSRRAGERQFLELRRPQCFCELGAQPANRHVWLVDAWVGVQLRLRDAARQNIRVVPLPPQSPSRSLRPQEVHEVDVLGRGLERVGQQPAGKPVGIFGRPLQRLRIPYRMSNSPAFRASSTVSFCRGSCLVAGSIQGSSSISRSFPCPISPICDLPTRRKNKIAALWTGAGRRGALGNGKLSVAPSKGGVGKPTSPPITTVSRTSARAAGRRLDDHAAKKNAVAKA